MCLSCGTHVKVSGQLLEVGSPLSLRAPGHETQVLSLGNKYPYLLGHLANLKSLIFQGAKLRTGRCA